MLCCYKNNLKAILDNTLHLKNTLTLRFEYNYLTQLLYQFFFYKHVFKSILKYLTENCFIRKTFSQIQNNNGNGDKNTLCHVGNQYIPLHS